jgi:hypothetical protein
VHPKPAYHGVHVYSDSVDADISEEEIDSFENSQSITFVNKYSNEQSEDSDEIYDEEDDSREEETGKSQKGHIVPQSPFVDVSEEVNDSREVEHSHEMETVSDEKYSSNEVKHTSHETVESEDDSIEAEDSKGSGYKKDDDSTEHKKEDLGPFHGKARSLSEESSEIFSDSEEVEDSREV